MSEKTPELTGSPENQIQSRHGIRYNFGHQIAYLNIPKEVMDIIGGRDVVARDLHPKIFNGSWPLGGQMHDEWYTVEFSQNTSMGKLQELIDAIENLYDQKTNK